jgi:TonB family protein
VEVAFQVRSNGYINNLEVRRSSWNSALDGQAMRTVKLSEPFERIPNALTTSLINVLATVRFGEVGGRATFAIERATAKESK